MKTTKEKILLTPVDQLELHKECVANLKLLGIGNLQEFIDKGWENLRNDENFNYVWFNKVVKFLDEKNLLHLLEHNN